MNCEDLIVEHEFKRDTSENRCPSPLLARLEAQSLSVKIAAEDIETALENAQNNKQAMLEKKAIQLKERNERVKDVSRQKKQEEDEKAARKAAEIAAALELAEAKRTAEKEASVEKLKTKHQHVNEVQSKRRSLDAAEKEAMEKQTTEKLAVADAKRVAEMEASVEKVKAKNQRVSEVNKNRRSLDAAEKESLERDTAEKLEAAEAKRIADINSKMEKTKGRNSRVSEVQRKKEEAEALEKEALDRETAQRLAEAEARRTSLLEERCATVSLDMAKVKGVHAMVRAKQQQDMMETDEKLRERLSAAEERRLAALADSREKGATVVRHAMQVAAQQQEKDNAEREELKAEIESKLEAAHIRREAVMGSPNKMPFKMATAPCNSPATTPETTTADEAGFVYIGDGW